MTPDKQVNVEAKLQSSELTGVKKMKLMVIFSQFRGLQKPKA